VLSKALHELVEYLLIWLLHAIHLGTDLRAWVEFKFLSPSES